MSNSNANKSRVLASASYSKVELERRPAQGREVARQRSNPQERRTRSRSAPGFRSRKGEKLVEGLTKVELVQKYETKVRFVAMKMAQSLPNSVEYEDLVSVGFIGLMDAADKYNSAKGVKFSTYAEFRIRGAILDELRSQDWVPHCARGRAKAIEKAYHKLERENGRTPSDAELSEELGMDRERLQKTRDAVSHLQLVSLDAQEGEASLQQPAEDREGTNPYIEATKKDAKAYLEGLFSELPEEERVVLACYYFRGLNLREISTILNLSESRISQLHTKAILRLKEKIKAETGCAKSMFMMLLEA